MAEKTYIAANTVADFGDVSVGAASMERDLIKEGDETRMELTAILYFANGNVEENVNALVIVGHEFDMFGCHFKVLDIEENEGIWLEVEQLEPPCLPDEEESQ